MSRESLVVLSGLLILSLPYLGVPAQWKLYAMVGAGTLLMVVGYSLRRSAYQRRLERINNERGSDSFVERDGRATSLAEVPQS